MRRRLQLFAIACILTACQSESGPTADFFVSQDQGFILQAGDTVGIDGGLLIVSFDNVLGDSRCPANVTCVQAGAATVELTIQSLDRQETIQIDVPPDGMAEAVFDTYLLSVVELAPEPVENVTPTIVDYAVAMIATAAP